MKSDLLERVERDFLPNTSMFGFTISHHEESEAFGDALVVLQAGDLRIRLVRDRGQVFVDFGSTADLATWFDSSVVFEFLELSDTSSWHSRDTSSVLNALQSFIQVFGKELSRKFAPSSFPMTRRNLVELREPRANKQYGPL